MRSYSNTLWQFGSSILVVCACFACGSNDPKLTDAGSGDTGVDAPYIAPDGGPPGATLEPTDPCTDVADGLYTTPAGLPPFAESVRGEVLGCALLETIGAAEVATRMSAVPDAIVSGGAVRVYLVAYRTEREPGIGGISTALVYLPDVAASERVPLVLAMHGSVGLGDQCAPSHLIYDPTSFLSPAYRDAMFLSWAARGLPVVAPDYAGLGTDGVHAYTSWVEPARSGIDGARALRSLLAADRLDGTTLVYGHSQGGGLALGVAAQAATAPDLDLRAIVAIAPAYRIATEVALLRLAAGVTVTDELRAALSFGLYSDLANLTTVPAELGAAFRPEIRDHTVSAVSTLCYDEGIAALATSTASYTPPTRGADLFDPDFSAAALACADGGPCDSLAGRWVQRDQANEPHLPADAPPILVIGSNADESATRGIVGCVIDRVEADSVTPEICVGAYGAHRPMLNQTMAYGIAWALAASHGEPRPPCTGSTSAPRCSLF